MQSDKYIHTNIYISKLKNLIKYQYRQRNRANIAKSNRNNKKNIS